MARELRYITVSDIKEEIPDAVQGLMTDDAANSETKVDAIIEQKALAAESEFESYASTRYSLPVQAEDGTTPDPVRQTIYTILKYYLYGRRNADELVESQYDRAIRWLENVQNGKANIPFVTDDNEIENSAPSGQIQVGDGGGDNFDQLV